MTVDRLRKSLVWLIRVGPTSIAFYIGIIYVIIVLMNFSKDTTQITNAAFAIVSVLAGLSFGMASVISNEEIKGDFVYSGERFFHAAFFLIFASILKYAALTISASSLLESSKIISQLLTCPLNALVQICFMYAVVDSHTGITLANKRLWERLFSRRDWNSIW